ncbi:hypothetical protein ACHELY_003689 [Vibrio vulnificus]
MQLSLTGYWQLSPLTDLSIPQDDLCFPAPLSEILPASLSEQAIAAQEWHLMHDIEVDDSLLAYPAVEMVLAGVDYHAEVRLNGIAVFDCDKSQFEYRKDIRPYLQHGRNRFEILFLEEEEELLFEEDRLALCELGENAYQPSDGRMGIWREPYLQFIRHVRLDRVTTEQIWHHGGGCEFKVDLYYQTYASGLISASVKFDGRCYSIPLDLRSDHASALFQIDAPSQQHEYQLEIELDGQILSAPVTLDEATSVTHFIR